MLGLFKIAPEHIHRLPAVCTYDGGHGDLCEFGKRSDQTFRFGKQNFHSSSYIVDRSDILALLQRWKPQLLQGRLLRYAIAVVVTAVAAYFVTEGVAGVLPAQWPMLLRLALAGVAILLACLPILVFLFAALGIPPGVALAEVPGRTMPQRPATSDSVPNG